MSFVAFPRNTHPAALFLLTMLALGARPICSQAADSETKSTSSRLLVGGIRHSEELPPLPADLEAGKLFNGLAQQSPAPVVAPLGSVATVNASQQSVRRKLPGKSPQPLKQQLSANAAAPLKPVSSGSASRQMSDYLQKQAKLGNRGTVGLTNYLAVSASQSSSQLKRSGHSSAPVSSSGRSSHGSHPARAAARRFQVPPWLAGVWARSDSTELSRTELPSRKLLKPVGHSIAKVEDAFGTYRDEKGVIWQVFDPNKASGSVDRGDKIDYHLVSSYEITKASDKQVLVSVRAAHVVVSKKTHRIVTSYQDEELNTLTAVEGGRLRTDSSVKVFNAKGKPQLLTKAVSMETKVRGL